MFIQNFNTVDSKILCDLFFVIFLFLNKSQSFEFASEHLYGRSFLWVKTRHSNVSFGKVKSCSALRIAVNIWSADFNWHSNVIVSLNTLKSLVHI